MYLIVQHLHLQCIFSFNWNEHIWFHLRIKTCSPCLYSLVKTEASVSENSRADQWKPKTQSRIFTCSRILIKGFHNSMKARGTGFISFIKLLFSVLTKRKMICMYVYFNFFHETVNSHNLKTANHIAHVISVLWSI